MICDGVPELAKKNVNELADIIIETGQEGIDIVTGAIASCMTSSTNFWTRASSLSMEISSCGWPIRSGTAKFSALSSSRISGCRSDANGRCRFREMSIQGPWALVPVAFTAV